MDDVTSIWYGDLPENSGFVRPFRMYYVQNGVKKNWDLAQVEDTVSIIIYNKTTGKLIFVKQFRPVAYYDAISKLGCKHSDEIDLVKYPAKLGVTFELCTGTVDKNLSVKEIAQEEIEEECGYKIPLDRIEEVMSYRSDVGTSGALETMFYCEVTDKDKISDGGGVGDEIIDVVEISIQEAKEMVTAGGNNLSPPNCLMGVLWFLRNKAPRPAKVDADR